MESLSVQMMDKAIDVHDRIMRGLLGKHFGFEVTTEGDAFQFVFHHANDAVSGPMHLMESSYADTVFST